jgi:hypothetical protein
MDISPSLFFLLPLNCAALGRHSLKGNDIALMRPAPQSPGPGVRRLYRLLSHTFSSVQKVLYLPRHDVGYRMSETAVLSL